MPADMDATEQFEVLIALLKRVVAARNQDPEAAAAPYLARRPIAGVPASMVTLGPMLTGSTGSAGAGANADASIVPVPTGMGGPHR
jgi:hypothetical protein